MTRKYFKFFITLCFCSSRIAFAQQSPVIQLNDSLLLGFDEQQALSEMHILGVSQSDSAEFMHHSKVLYILSHQNSNTASPQISNHVIQTRSVRTDPCDNVGFESGNFNNWSGYTGTCCPINATTPGIVPGRHTIVTGAGTDPVTGISLIAPGGGTYSTKLGDMNIGAQAEKLVRTFLVTPSNTNFTYQYAVILEDPGHSQSAQPRFEVKMYDASNRLIPCGYYSVTSQAGIPGFRTTVDQFGETVRYKDWTTVGVDLTPYMGQTITIEFSTGDCSLGGHYGYAYVDASCGTLQVGSTFCAGDTRATLTAPSGFSNYTWSNGATTQSTIINLPQAGTTYSVTMQSVTGCPTTLEITLVEQILPVIVATADTIMCEDQPINLNASGGNSYHWSSIPAGFNSNISNPTDTPAVNTDYIVQATNICGSSYDTVQVTLKPKPIIDAGIDQYICPGNFTQLNASSNVPDFSWMANPNLSCTNCLTPNVLGDGTYYLTATDISNGCSAIDSISVITVVPSADAGRDVTICYGNSIQLNGTGGLSYAWSPSTGLSCTTCATPIANPIIDTKYFLTITNLGGCNSIDSVVVTVNPLPTKNINQDTVICNQQTVQLQEPSGNLYFWQPSAGLSCTSCYNPVASPNDTTIYYVTITNSLGCSILDTVTVNVKPTLTGDAGPDFFVCPGSPVQINASVDPSATYFWTNSPDLSCTNCLNPMITTNTTNTYYLNIENPANNCIINDSVIVNISIPHANAGNDATICRGQGVQLTGSGGNFYSWAPAATLSCTICSNPIANPTNNRTRYILTVSNVGGCSSKDTVFVNVNAVPTADAGIDETICSGTTVTLTATGGGVYSWSPSATLNCSTCSSVKANPTNTTKYFITITNNLGCSSIDSVIVNVNPTPSVDAGFGPSTCPGQPVNLFANSSVNSYYWTANPELSCTNCLNPVATPFHSTMYYFNGIDPTANHCNAIDSVFISLSPTPNADAGPDRTIECYQTGVTLLGSGNGNYNWNPSAGLSCTTCDSPIATLSSNETYILTVINSFDCMDSDTVNVTVETPPIADFSMSYYKVCEGKEATFYNNSSGADVYFWDFGDGTTSTDVNPQHTFKSNNPYIVSLMVLNSNNSNACKDTAQQAVAPLDTYRDIFVPNTFTPNNDGNNDVFRVRGGTDYSNFHLMVYNRWGQLVFETTDPNTSWDGVFEGRPSDPAAYAWYLTVSCDDGSNKISQKGNVTLIR